MNPAATAGTRGRRGRDVLRDSDRELTVLVVLALAALAWTLLAMTHTGHAGGPAPGVDRTLGGHAEHSSTAGDGPSSPVLALGLLGLTGWVLMVVAMMLPPALPLLQTARRLAARRPDPWRLTALSAMTFVWVWTGVGAVLVTGDLGVRALWAGQGWTALPPTVSGAVLLAAGLYQFSPLKDRCLRGCRSPRSFALAHWHGRRPPGAEMVALSGAYAVSCVGCCWALMLVCFAVGTAALPAMVALSVLMAAERLVPWGRRLVRPAGLLLVGLGAAVLLDLPATEILFL